MNVEWKNPNSPPAVERGETVKVWALVDVMFYDTKWGGIGADGKAERTCTLTQQLRVVIELNFGNVSATQEEMDYLDEHGELPDSSPENLSDWLTEDGELIAINGFFREYNEEGRCFVEVFKELPSGEICLMSGWHNNLPETVILAWADFQKPSVPEMQPDSIPRNQLPFSS